MQLTLLLRLLCFEIKWWCWWCHVFTFDK